MDSKNRGMHCIFPSNDFELTERKGARSCFSPKKIAVFKMRMNVNLYVTISATAIREGIAQQKNVRPLLPEAVWTYVDANLLYR